MAITKIKRKRRVKLEGLSRPVEEMFSRERRDIPAGSYSVNELVEELIDGWIPFVECHQCSRFRSCKYPVRHPTNPHRAAEFNAASPLNRCATS